MIERDRFVVEELKRESDRYHSMADGEIRLAREAAERGEYLRAVAVRISEVWKNMVNEDVVAPSPAWAEAVNSEMDRVLYDTLGIPAPGSEEFVTDPSTGDGDVLRYKVDNEKLVESRDQTNDGYYDYYAWDDMVFEIGPSISPEIQDRSEQNKDPMPALRDIPLF